MAYILADIVTLEHYREQAISFSVVFMPRLMPQRKWQRKQLKGD